MLADKATIEGGTGMPAKTKTCTRCKRTRKLEAFYKDKHMKDGLSSWCKACTKAYDREYRARKNAEAKS
jgi:hypothetical protein